MLRLFGRARRDISHDALLAGIGQQLRAEHAAVKEPLPERLGALIRQLEQAPGGDWRPRHTANTGHRGVGRFPPVGRF